MMTRTRPDAPDPMPGDVTPAMHEGNPLVPIVVVSSLLLVAAGITGVLVGCSKPESSLPVYWEAPEFALVDQEGGTLRTADLHGTVWVASFVFTNCTDVCPLITQQMARLRDSLGQEGLLGGTVRLVSFSVDPARDTPAALRNYAGRFGGSPPNEWAFLTGTPPEAVRSMIQQGFKLTAMMPPGHERLAGSYQVRHSPRLVLVDPAGRVRGAYDTTEPETMERLRADLGALLEEPGGTDAKSRSD